MQCKNTKFILENKEKKEKKPKPFSIEDLINSDGLVTDKNHVYF